MFSTIIDGEADAADVLWLIAVILFAVVAVRALIVKGWDTALTAAGLLALALGALVL